MYLLTSVFAALFPSQPLLFLLLGALSFLLTLSLSLPLEFAPVSNYGLLLDLVTPHLLSLTLTLTRISFKPPYLAANG